MIEQDGKFYLAAIVGPSLNTGSKGGSTGFNTISQSGLVAADFSQFNFSTDTFSSGTPNFAGDSMLFGLGQIFGVNTGGANVETAAYDNLKLDIATVPEPSTLWLVGSLLPVLAAIRVARRR